ncbi:hypothetical protein F5Y12DRAFT_798758 [Xylaria sp. FL1777]|nr:hypothetical protein F5Y12DRAFT_798758 [Xylaria sp. FL1777]
MDFAAQIVESIVEKSNEDLFSLISKSRQVNIYFDHLLSKTLHELGLNTESLPKHLERYGLLAHTFNSLTVRQPWQVSVRSIMDLWSKHELGTSDLYSDQTLGQNPTFLYKVILPFVDDYANKAEKYVKQRRPSIYNIAPLWAYSSLLRRGRATKVSCLQEPVLSRMKLAFFHFQIFCELHNTIKSLDSETHSHHLEQHERNWEIALQYFCGYLVPIELDEFRSILWYVSTLWAILLDELEDDACDAVVTTGAAAPATVESNQDNADP